MKRVVGRRAMPWLLPVSQLRESRRGAHCFHATPVTLRTHRRISASEAIDLENTAADNRMENSLFDDPTGGLSFTEATELSESELHRELASSANSFDPIVYAIAFCPVVDLVDLMNRSNLLPYVKPEVSASRWLQDPRILFLRPRSMEEAMGAEKWAIFSERVQQWWNLTQETTPLRRVCAKYNVNPDLIVPLFRQIGVNLWSRNWEVRQERLQVLPGIVLALSSGKGEKVVRVSDEMECRVRFVAEILMALSQETGHASTAFLGIQLLRANKLDVPYRVQKSLTNVFSSIQRIKTDWDLRGSGQLLSAVPKWTRGYLRRVEQESSSASPDPFLEATAEAAPLVPRDGDPVSTYFSREINPDVKGLKANIAASLHQRQKEAIAREEEGAAAKAVESKNVPKRRVRKPKVVTE